MRTTLAAIVVLAVLVVIGGYQLTTSAPVLISSGLVVAALAPLAFMLATLGKRVPTGKTHHPVLVSVVTGFGCVMTMAGVHRFGDDHKPLLVGALVALCIWMAWQKWCWRAGREHTE